MDFEKLNEFLEEEYKDVISYVGIFKKSENPIFKDIAREEYVHAKHIENLLKEAGKLTDHKEIKEKAKAALEEV